MKRVDSTDKLQRGAVLLTGSAYYYVTEIFPKRFRGFVWDHQTRAWGALREVPLPSLTCAAYDVTSERLFPDIATPDVNVAKAASVFRCYISHYGYNNIPERVHERRDDGSCVCGEYPQQQH